jgi:predicted  nucleic acid-binding Zn-ribbon protein
MTAANFAIIGSVIVSGLGAIFGLYQARKADKSASTTKIVEIAVRDLVDQHQEDNKALRDQAATREVRVTALQAEVHALEDEVHELRSKVNSLERLVALRDEEIIHLRLSAGGTLDG